MAKKQSETKTGYVNIRWNDSGLSFQRTALILPNIYTRNAERHAKQTYTAKNDEWMCGGGSMRFSSQFG